MNLTSSALFFCIFHSNSVALNFSSLLVLHFVAFNIFDLTMLYQQFSHNYPARKQRIMMYLLRLCCNMDSPPANRIDRTKQIRKNKTQTKNQSQIGEPLPQLSHLSVSDVRESVLCSRITKVDHYEGEQMNGIPNGNGSMLYANGDFYRGEWINGKKEGRGLQIYHEKNYQYEGQWQNDMLDGPGKLIFQNSSYYIGDFKEGNRHGKGQYYDSEKKKQYNQCYERGELKEQKEVVLQRSNQEEFPTLNLDKQRFTTQDLNHFEEMHPSIQELDLSFFLKYYSLCKLSKLQFISKNLSEWNIREVLEFLDLIELKNYKEIFYKNKLKGKHLKTLNESQLKQDLKMKLGDRKRFMNFLRHLNGLDERIIQKSSSKKTKKGGNYKLLSVDSMRNALRNVKNEVYQQSIMEQSSESEKEPNKYLKRHEAQKKEDQSAKEMFSQVQSHKYVSAAEHVPTQGKCEQNFSSLEKLIEARSERSEEHSSSKRDLTRKNSRDMDQLVFNQTHHNIIEVQNANEFQRYSQNYIPPQVEHCESESSDSDSSKEISKIKVKRKQTIQKSHLNLQSSQIRELYDFLKQHRSLSFFIKQKDIQNIQLIGEGGFGKVYRGKYIGQQIAIKDYLKTGKHRYKQDFMKELEIISDLKHPNIVLYMGICITANKYTLITEYLQNGSLFDQLHRKKKKFTQSQQMSITSDIVKGMVYLHNMKKILHRDLKSSNVLIGQNWQVKLCDFGLSGQKKKSSKRNNNKIGTAQWMAPQVMRNQDKIDQYADVYSFGVIIWELLSERVPFQGLSQQQIAGLVGYDDQHTFQEPKGPKFLKSIMRKCLNRHPAQRPKFIEIQSEFEQQYNMLKEKPSPNENMT